MVSFEYAIFGNRGGGHQLLETSLDGEDSMLDELRFLVDRPAGHVGAEVQWSPYWGCSPLGRWWVLWRGEEDCEAPRRNMVRSRVVLVQQDMVGLTDTVDDLVAYLSSDPAVPEFPAMNRIADALAGGERPVVVPGISTAPALLLSLWPRLWPAARRRFTVRTLFGNEGVDPEHSPDIIVIPVELAPRWRVHGIVGDQEGEKDGIGAFWLKGSMRPELERLLRVNWDRLPSDVGVLTRLHRVATAIERLQEGTSELATALLIVRTLEAFDGDLELPPPDLALLVAHVSEMRGATIEDVRTASLVRLTILGDAVALAERATARWIRENLPGEANRDALWILEHQAGHHHASWWLRAIQEGLSDSLENLPRTWAAALWRWWSVNPDALDWTEYLLPADSTTEASLLPVVPSALNVDLRTKVVALCAKRQWARLLARVIRNLQPLDASVRMLRERIVEPELGLDALLEVRVPTEVVAAAASCVWQPLIIRASGLTVNEPSLLCGIDRDSPGAIVLCAVHVRAGGSVPSEFMSGVLVRRVFDGCIDGDDDCLEIVQHIGGQMGSAAVVYENVDELWEVLGSVRRDALLTAAADAWLGAFVAYEPTMKPGQVLGEAICSGALAALGRGPIERVIEFFKLFDVMSEREMVQWLSDEGFRWQVGDAEQLGALLEERGWAVATRNFRYSWKEELRMVGWEARNLLSYWDRPFAPPSGFTDRLEVPFGEDYVEGQRRRTRMKILLLAANPTASPRLRIDEEVRAIEEKVRQSSLRDAVQVCSRWATRPGDLQKALLDEDPTVVHFSGHGGGTVGIVLHSEEGTEESLVSSEALAQLFTVLKENIRLVVMNACYSVDQATAIAEKIDCVVGMGESIGDEGARVFAGAFYQGLGYGKSVQTAFDLGLNELRLMGFAEEEMVPVLRTREDIDASTVTLL